MWLDPCQAVFLGEVAWVEILLCHLWDPKKAKEWTVVIRAVMSLTLLLFSV